MRERRGWYRYTSRERNKCTNDKHIPGMYEREEDKKRSKGRANWREEGREGRGQQANETA